MIDRRCSDISCWKCSYIRISPREPHALAWGPSSSHTKIFRIERTKLKTGEKLPIPCKFCTQRFIRYSSTCYGKVRIDPLMANIRNPDFFASPVVNAAWLVVVPPCYLNWDLLSGPKRNKQDRFQAQFLRNWPVRATLELTSKPRKCGGRISEGIFYEICLNFVKIFLQRLDLRLFGVLMLILTPILLMTNETKHLILWWFEFLRTALAPQSVDLIGQINWKMLGSQLLLLPSYKPRTQRSQCITFLDLSKRSDYIIRCFMAPLFLTWLIWD